MHGKIDNTAGFTIIELLVSIVIFVVILMAMASFSTLLIRTQGANEVRNTVVKTALDKLHQTDFLPFSSTLTNSSGFFQVRDSSIPYTVSFSTSTPVANMKKIDETIIYTYRGKSHSFTLLTIVLK